ncbi:hypothetical protein BVC93_32260 (plasmid) [Mycobacterium sp. MS1601]|uniref:neutral zinc metallopeptidase n=1 Tax=Mycobacteriaceae TaxID=1762 RepID=UPI0009796D32|nr:hypothetical protein BVC93_32260 [Mycobacterium sp. MS1601]
MQCGTTPRRRWISTATAFLTILLAGCSSTTGGHAVSPLTDPFRVGGLPAADGPSGPRDNAPAPEGQIANTDNGPIDQLALLGINDVEAFWQEHYADIADGTFQPVETLLSYDSEDPLSPRACGMPTYEMINAFYCIPLHGIAWDRGVLFPVGEKFFSDMAVVAVLAHEYGHAVQQSAGLVDEFTPTLVAEQQADCMTGMYLRTVAEDQSPRFTLSTGDGLNRVLAGAIAMADRPLGPFDADDVDDGHGSALDRVSALQMGFTTGADACTAIDLTEIENRRGDLPVVMEVADLLDGGQRELTGDLIEQLADQLYTIFNPARTPALSFSASEQRCPDAAAVTPAGYCPATNTLTVDLDGLREMGAVSDLDNYTLQQGDFSALSVVISRYAQAIQHDRGLPLDTAMAGLRTACLTGAAHRALTADAAANGLTLNAGDIDETVSGLLTNGLAASDVNGAAAPAGFTRIHAFRAGLSADTGTCYQQFTD